MIKGSTINEDNGMIISCIYIEECEEHSGSRVCVRLCVILTVSVLRGRHFSVCSKKALLVWMTQCVCVCVFISLYILRIGISDSLNHTETFLWSP